MTRRTDTGSRPTRTQILREAARAAEARSAPGRDAGVRTGGTTLHHWEAEQRERRRRHVLQFWARVRSPARVGLMIGDPQRLSSDAGEHLIKLSKRVVVSYPLLV
jgi:hypothetical protein